MMRKLFQLLKGEVDVRADRVVAGDTIVLGFLEGKVREAFINEVGTCVICTADMSLGYKPDDMVTIVKRGKE